MHETRYRFLALELVSKFGAKASSVEGFLIPYHETIGFVEIKDGSVNWNGKNDPDLSGKLLQIAKNRDEEFKKKKYRSLSDDEILFKKLLYETTEVLNGKARIRR